MSDLSTPCERFCEIKGGGNVKQWCTEITPDAWRNLKCATGTRHRYKRPLCQQFGIEDAKIADDVYSAIPDYEDEKIPTSYLTFTPITDFLGIGKGDTHFYNWRDIAVRTNPYRSTTAPTSRIEAPRIDLDKAAQVRRYVLDTYGVDYPRPALPFLPEPFFHQILDTFYTLWDEKYSKPGILALGKLNQIFSILDREMELKGLESLRKRLADDLKFALNKPESQRVKDLTAVLTQAVQLMMETVPTGVPALAAEDLLKSGVFKQAYTPVATQLELRARQLAQESAPLDVAAFALSLYSALLLTGHPSEYTSETKILENVNPKTMIADTQRFAAPFVRTSETKQIKKLFEDLIPLFESIDTTLPDPQGGYVRKDLADILQLIKSVSSEATASKNLRSLRKLFERLQYHLQTSEGKQSTERTFFPVSLVNALFDDNIDIPESKNWYQTIHKWRDEGTQTYPDADSKQAATKLLDMFGQTLNVIQRKIDAGARPTSIYETEVELMTKFLQGSRTQAHAAANSPTARLASLVRKLERLLLMTSTTGD